MNEVTLRYSFDQLVKAMNLYRLQHSDTQDRTLVVLFIHFQLAFLMAYVTCWLILTRADKLIAIYAVAIKRFEKKLE